MLRLLLMIFLFTISSLDTRVVPLSVFVAGNLGKRPLSPVHLLVYPVRNSSRCEVSTMPIPARPARNRSSVSRLDISAWTAFVFLEAGHSLHLSDSGAA